MIDYSKQPSSRGAKKRRPERILLVCCFDPAGIGAVSESVYHLQRLSTFSIDVQNFYGRLSPFRWPATFSIHDYDAIVFHNTVTYEIEVISHLDAHTSTRLKDYEGVKIFFKQDEHHRAHRVARVLGSYGADLVFSCLPENQYETVYPRKLAGDIEFVRMLTGYVTQEMRNFKFSQSDARPVDVGYRGSRQPIFFGRLAYEKSLIAERFLARAAGGSLALDISSAWADRLQGKRWIEFLASCKATLGTESGASIFDLEGHLQDVYRAVVREIGEHPDDSAWCEAALEKLAKHEGVVRYNQISPRHFEAAATRTVQLLFEGRYSDILVAGKHYLPLRKDFSNFDHVIERLRDARLRKDLTDCAFEEVVLQHSNSVEAFAELFDRGTEAAFSKKQRPRKGRILGAPAHRNVLLICGHKPDADPRIGWIANHAAPDTKIHVIGLHDDPARTNPEVKILPSGAMEFEIYRRRERAGWLGSLPPPGEDLNEGTAATALLELLHSAPTTDLAAYVGVDEDAPRLTKFRWYLKYFVDNGIALARAGSNLSGVDVVIATDLDTLAAGVMLKAKYGAMLIYDAHEFWPESDVENTEWESRFWRSLEERLVAEADFATTVSKPLADYMSGAYKKRFFDVPNCEPLQPIPVASAGGRLIGPNAGVSFLYQGSYASGRGLERLISLWPKTNESAILFLRGRTVPYRESLVVLAEASGMLGRRIFFLDPVEESEMVRAAAAADVGVIPYGPVNVCYRYCCPNKLSQYAQASLPILANYTEFVADIVTSNGIGVVVDFESERDTLDAINSLVEDPERRRALGQAGRNFVSTQFHWGVVSRPLFNAISEFGVGQTALHPMIYSPEFAVRRRRPYLGRLRIFASRSLRSLMEQASDPGSRRNVFFYLSRAVWRILPSRFRYKLSSVLPRLF